MSIGAAVTLVIAAGTILWGAGVILRERRLAHRMRINQAQPAMFQEPDAQL